MSAEKTWKPFGIDDSEFGDTARNGTRILNVSMRRPKDENTADPSARWLRSAVIGLGLLAAAAAAVSFAAQYQLILAAKGVPWAAALEAGIPDAGSMVFASLGIALALKGKRAVRARALNVACVALSLMMNALAAKSGWRNMAVWVMPSAVYALASDTLIGTLRAYILARLGKSGDDRTMLDVFGRAALYGLRFVLAMPSTATGLRRQVLVMTPLPDASRAEIAAPDVAALPAAPETLASTIPVGGRPNPRPGVSSGW